MNVCKTVLSEAAILIYFIFSVLPSRVAWFEKPLTTRNQTGYVTGSLQDMVFRISSLEHPG